MSTQTLTRVTLDTLDNYGRAATEAVSAYRVGSERLTAAVDDLIAERVTPPLAKLAPRAQARMGQARRRMLQIVRKGIDTIATRSESAIERSRTAAVAQVGRISRLAARVQTPALANGLQAVARMSLPGAKMVLAVSGKVADGAGKLAGAAAGKLPAKLVRRSAEGAKRAARKVKAQAVAATPAPQRRTRVAKAAPAPKARAARRSAA